MTQDQIHDGLNTTMWTGASAAILGGVTLTEWLAIAGFLLALAGFVVNVWHKRQMVHLAREKLEMDRARKETDE